MIGLLLPAALLGLAALAIPLWLHLRPRSEETPLDFPALRYLGAAQAPRAQRQLREPLLLALRLLLLTALAVLLAWPVWHPHARPTKSWALVDAALGNPLAANPAGLQLPPDSEWHWLAPGLPLITADSAAPSVAAADAPAATLVSLLREADATLPAAQPLSVFVPAWLEYGDAPRLRVARPLHWQVIGSAPPSAWTPPRVQLADLPAHPTDEQRSQQAVLQALLADWQAQAWVQLPDPATNPAANAGGASAADWRLQAGNAVDADMQTWLAGGGVLLLGACPDSSAFKAVPEAWLHDLQGHILLRQFAVPAGKGALLCAASALTPAATPAVLDAQFPQQVYQALRAAAPEPAVPAEAVMPLPPPSGDPERADKPAHASAAPAKATDLHAAFVLAVLALLLLERSLALAAAWRRTREVA